MNDPHVEALYYNIGTDSDSISYGDPTDVSFDNDIGKFELVDCKLTVTPIDHYSSPDSARSVVDPFLKSWELHTDLTANLGQLRFTYKDAKVIDRDPQPPYKEYRGTFEVVDNKVVFSNSLLTPPERFYVEVEGDSYLLRTDDYKMYMATGQLPDWTLRKYSD